MATLKRSRSQIKIDAQKIYKLSLYYRFLSEIASILGLSEEQVKKSLQTEEIYDDVLQNLEQNKIIGNNFYFVDGEFRKGKYYLCTGATSEQKAIFILKGDNVLHCTSYELIEVQPGDIVFEIWKEKQNFIINKSQITRQRNQAKNIERKTLKKGEISNLTGIELAMISWF